MRPVLSLLVSPMGVRQPPPAPRCELPAARPMVVMNAACAFVGSRARLPKARHGCCTVVLHVDTPEGSQEDWWVPGYNLMPGLAHLLSDDMPV
jgi:hypothetical protein